MVCCYKVLQSVMVCYHRRRRVSRLGNVFTLRLKPVFGNIFIRGWGWQILEKLRQTKEITVVYVNACQWTLPIWCFLCKLWKKFSTGHMIAISFFAEVNMQFSTSQNTDSYLTNATVLLRLKRFFSCCGYAFQLSFFSKNWKLSLSATPAFLQNVKFHNKAR